MSNRDAHARGSGGARGQAWTAAVLLVAIGALIALGLAVSRAPNRPKATVPRSTGPAAALTRIEANRREGGVLIDMPLATKLAALRGAPVVVNQWASWCPPCRAEFAFFAELAERYRNEVAFLGLNSRDQRSAAAAFLKRHSVPYPSVFDERGEQARSIGAGIGWPTTLFFDADGTRVFIRQGGYRDAAALEADIREHALGLSP